MRPALQAQVQTNHQPYIDCVLQGTRPITIPSLLPPSTRADTSTQGDTDNSKVQTNRDTIVQAKSLSYNFAKTTRPTGEK